MSAHYQNPFLTSSKPFQVTGILFEAGRRVARSVKFSPFNRDDPSDWIRQQDRGFAAVKDTIIRAQETPLGQATEACGTLLRATYRGIGRSPYRSRRLTKKRNANQWTKKKSSTSYRRPTTRLRRISKKKVYPGKKTRENTPRSRYRATPLWSEVSSGRQHLRWKKDIELEEYGRVCTRLS